MLLHDKLKSYNVILASASPRRRELLRATGIEYHLAEKFECEETYHASLDAMEVAPYLSLLKSHAYPTALAYNDLLITADTTVVLDGKVLGKPSTESEAREMIAALAGREHSVVTGVTLRMQDRERTFSSQSKVRFAPLSTEQIDYYVDNYHPMDKAGAYGIQGKFAPFIDGIDGDYYNVVGFPIAAVISETRALGVDLLSDEYCQIA